MVASTPAAALARAVAAELAFEVVLLAVARFPQVVPALPGIHGFGQRRFSVGFAGRAACIPAADRKRTAVEAVAFAVFSSIPLKCVQSGATGRLSPR